MAKISKKDAEALEEEVAKGPEGISPDVLRAITGAKRGLKLKFGNDLFSEKQVRQLPAISTGSMLLDQEIGNGGLVCGRIHEIFGGSGSSKTTMSTMVCANALKKFPDKFIVYVDAEMALDLEYTKSLGLDIYDDRVILIQSQSCEEIFESVEALIRTGGVSLVIIDSVPAMLTKAEAEKGYDEMTIGAKAKFLSTSIPKMLKLLKETDTTMIFVNQVRDNVGSYGGGSTTPGK